MQQQRQQQQHSKGGHVEETTTAQGRGKEEGGKKLKHPSKEKLSRSRSPWQPSSASSPSTPASLSPGHPSPSALQALPSTRHPQPSSENLRKQQASASAALENTRIARACQARRHPATAGSPSSAFFLRVTSKASRPAENHGSQPTEPEQRKAKREPLPPSPHHIQQGRRRHRCTPPLTGLVEVEEERQKNHEASLSKCPALAVERLEPFANIKEEKEKRK